MQAAGTLLWLATHWHFTDDSPPWQVANTPAEELCQDPTNHIDSTANINTAAEKLLLSSGPS